MYNILLILKSPLILADSTHEANWTIWLVSPVRAFAPNVLQVARISSGEARWPTGNAPAPTFWIISVRRSRALLVLEVLNSGQRLSHTCTFSQMCAWTIRSHSPSIRSIYVGGHCRLCAVLDSLRCRLKTADIENLHPLHLSCLYMCCAGKCFEGRCPRKAA